MALKYLNIIIEIIPLSLDKLTDKLHSLYRTVVYSEVNKKKMKAMPWV